MCGMFPFPVEQGVCEWEGCMCSCVCVCACTCMNACLWLWKKENQRNSQFRQEVHPVSSSLWINAKVQWIPKIHEDLSFYPDILMLCLISVYSYHKLKYTLLYRDMQEVEYTPIFLKIKSMPHYYYVAIFFCSDWSGIIWSMLRSGNFTFFFLLF